MKPQAMRTAGIIMIASAVMIGAAFVRGITWSLGHNPHFSSGTAQELPDR